jgi:hypothetical protein
MMMVMMACDYDVVDGDEGAGIAQSVQRLHFRLDDMRK